mgnify:CR=1 FL=1
MPAQISLILIHGAESISTIACYSSPPKQQHPLLTPLPPSSFFITKSLLALQIVSSQESIGNRSESCHFVPIKVSQN